MADVTYDSLRKAGSPIPWQALFYIGHNLSLVDLGSNDGRSLAGLDHSKMTVVEAYEPSVEKLREQDFNEVIHDDVRDFVEDAQAAGRKWDYVTCFDVIEHLPREDSLALIETAKSLCLKGMVFFVPEESPELHQDPEFQKYREWGLSQHPDGQRTLMDHLSFWNAADFEALGFVTVRIENFHRTGFHAFWAAWYADAGDRQTAILRVNEFISNATGTLLPQMREPLLVEGKEFMTFGQGVTIGKGAWIECVKAYGRRSLHPKLVIGEGVSAETSLHVACAGSVTIGRNTMIGSNVLITDHDHGCDDPTLPPRYQDLDVESVDVGEGCWIGDGAKILKAVSLAAGTVVGANSVVTRSFFDPGLILAGVPAKPIGRRERETVGLVIVTCGNFDRLDRCLDGIRSARNEMDLPLTVYVVDNGSTNDLARKAKRDPRINRYIRSEQNLGFGAGANLGMSQAFERHPLVALLNDDVVVRHGWLDELVDAMHRFPKAAIVGPISDNVSGAQAIGAIDVGGAKEPFPANHLVGFCWLMRSYYMRVVGLFDERFGMGNFEDDDLCIRTLACGYQLYICPRSFVHHDGHATFKELGVDLEASLKGNWEIFKEKWGIDRALPYGSSYNLNLEKPPLLDE